MLDKAKERVERYLSIILAVQWAGNMAIEGWRADGRASCRHDERQALSTEHT